MAEKDIKERMGVAENDIVTLYKNDEGINKVLDKVRNRLPNWGTFLISAIIISIKR